MNATHIRECETNRNGLCRDLPQANCSAVSEPRLSEPAAHSDGMLSSSELPPAPFQMQEQGGGMLSNTEARS